MRARRQLTPNRNGSFRRAPGASWPGAFLAASLVALPWLTGCAAAAGKEARATTAPENWTEAAPAYKLTDAVPLASLHAFDDDVEMVREIGLPVVPHTIFFGHVRKPTDDAARNGDDERSKVSPKTPPRNAPRGRGGNGTPPGGADDGHDSHDGNKDDSGGDEPKGGARADWQQRAVIAFQLDDRWRAVDVADDRVPNPAWVYNASGPKADVLWGILDSSDEKPAADLLILRSADGGVTWQKSHVHKPRPEAEFSHFTLAPDGRGRLTLYFVGEGGDIREVGEGGNDSDAERDARPKKGKKRGDAATKPAVSGYYQLDTRDGGCTWAAPRFEPDAMTLADDVPEDDQPGAGTVPARLRRNPSRMRHAH